MRRIAFNIKDQRLRDRISYCLERMSEAPGKSFPQIFKSQAQLEAFYRLVNNEHVEVESLISSISQDTSLRISSSSEDLIAIHDTTKVQPRSSSPEEFGPLSVESRGFFAHVCLITDLSLKPKVHGIGDVLFWTRPERGEESKNKFEEFSRWFSQVKSVERRLNTKKLVHVMDREGDSYELFSKLIEARHKFVIRLTHNRLIDSEKNEHLFEEIRSAEVIAERMVRLSYRKKSEFASSNKKFPPRDSRETTLSISAKTIKIKVSGWLKRHQKHKSLPELLQLNVVRVSEANPPQGEKPVEWLLITNEAIETKSEILRIVDIYRRRWLIEEFFKALKTGCQIQQRLISSLKPWYRMFCMFLPIAVSLINLRNLEELSIEEAKILSEDELNILIIMAKRRNIKLSTVNDLKFEIARLGGHIKSTGPPGWLVLARGLEELQKIAVGWSLHRDM